MGGIGSGKGWRWNSKRTCESQHGVDVRYLRRKGLLYEGAIGSLWWSSRGERTGSITYRVRDDRLILDFKTRRPGETDWREITQHITIDYTPCHYGGRRPWLRCPHCDRRVAIVYGAGTYFLCRHCHDLTYSTRQQDACDRRLSKARNIRERLGGRGAFDEPFPPKPKGMHWRTYDRLYREAMRAEQEGLEKLLMLEAKFLGTKC